MFAYETMSFHLCWAHIHATNGTKNRDELQYGRRQLNGSAQNGNERREKKSQPAQSALQNESNKYFVPLDGLAGFFFYA